MNSENEERSEKIVIVNPADRGVGMDAYSVRGFTRPC